MQLAQVDGELDPLVRPHRRRRVEPGDDERPRLVAVRLDLGEVDTHSNGNHGRLLGVVRAVEALGPEQLAHVEVEATPVLAEDVLEGLVDDGEEAQDLAGLKSEGEESRALLVARLDASTTVRPDERVELAVDLRKLHFFDLDSGSAIGA